MEELKEQANMYGYGYFSTQLQNIIYSKQVDNHIEEAINNFDQAQTNEYKTKFNEFIKINSEVFNAIFN